MARSVGDLVRERGPVTPLCCVAGGFAMGETTDAQALDQYDAMLAINFRTALHAARAVLPGMLAAWSGQIVTVGALDAVAGKAGMVAYGVAKSAVMQMTEGLAAETSGSGVRVNCVLPDIIDTSVNRAAMPDADFTKWTDPAAIARVMVFLCAPEFAAVHGALIPVAGGSNGIGNGIAQAFRRRGAAVHVWGTRATAADYTGEAGSDLTGLHYRQVDVTDFAVLEDVSPETDTLDVLVLRQGAVIYRHAEFAMPNFQRVVDINLSSIMACGLKFHGMLARTARNLIIVSSTAAFHATKGNPA